MRLFLFLPLFIFLFGTCFSQIRIETEETRFFMPSDSQKLSIHFREHSFFKNNEYFNTLYEGATFPGFLAEPTLVYQSGSTIRLEGGVRFLKYFGKDGIFRTEPLFRFQYQPRQWFQAILGTIYGGTNHQLIEPLYRWQRSFTDPSENGVQFLFKTNQLNADVWLNWQNFIFPQDHYQEELTYGTCLNWKLLPSENVYALSIPFQVLVNHHGGQNLSVDLPLRTIVNYATGLKSAFYPSGNGIKEWDLELWYLGYNDLSPQKLQAYRTGFALYPRTGISISDFMLQAGYYHGEMFASPEGETLFHNALIPYNGERRPARNLATLKMVFKKPIQKGITLAAYVETYTDLVVPQTDYCYGFHLSIDRSFFLKHIQ